MTKEDRRLWWVWLRGRVLWEVTLGGVGHPLEWARWRYLERTTRPDYVPSGEMIRRLLRRVTEEHPKNRVTRAGEDR